MITLREPSSPMPEPKAALEPYLHHLHTFVRREIEYYEGLGLLPAEAVRPEDVVDDVIATALSAWENRPQGSLRPWLLQLALRRLRQYLKAARERPSDDIPLEELVSQEDVSTLDLDTEIYEFYTPDDVVTWEDLLSDPAARSPEEWLELAELSHPLQQALATLPPRTREVFVLHALEGLREDEIARIYGWDTATVKQHLIQARDALRAQLTSARPQAAEGHGNPTSTAPDRPT